MAEESESKKFFNRLREATANVTQITKEGVETLQVKRELSQAYGDLGRQTAELVESGAVSHPDLLRARRPDRRAEGPARRRLRG